MSSPDDFDSTTSQKEVSYAIADVLTNKKVKIAYLKITLKTKAGSEIKKQLEKTIADLKAQGHEVQALDFPFLDYLVPIYYVLTTAKPLLT